jgi:hypothetical protein
LAGTLPAPEIAPHAHVHNFALGRAGNGEHLQVATFSSLLDFKQDKKGKSVSALFPSYQWTPIVCPQCQMQLGWLLQDSASGTKSDKKPARRSGGRGGGKDGAEKDTLHAMEKRCLFFPQGYWTVRFCHKVDVIQYHQEPNGQKAPIYNLGAYDTTGRLERPRVLTTGVLNLDCASCVRVRDEWVTE